jgi:hypothetical protein
VIKRFFKDAWRHVYNEHLNDGFKIFDTVARLIGYFGIYLTLTRIILAMTTAWPGHREFSLYLYITYFTTIFVISGLLIVARQSLHGFYDANEQRALVLKIQHRLVEVIRRAASSAVNNVESKLLKDDVELHAVLGDIMIFLHKRLNRNDIVMAVKYISGAAGDRKIDAVIRYPQPDSASVREDSMQADRSVVYLQFSEGNEQTQRVLIEDVAKLETDPSVGATMAARNTAYQHYARQCKFQSVLAFPLRQPRVQGAKFSAASILGFLSFDCPDPNAFDPLFLPTKKASSNDGRHLKDSPDIQFFFGLADSLATLAVLGAK